MSTMSNLKVPFQFSTNFPTSCQPQTGKVIISLKECLTINNIKRIWADVTKYSSFFLVSLIWTVDTVLSVGVISEYFGKGLFGKHLSPADRKSYNYFEGMSDDKQYQKNLSRCYKIFLLFFGKFNLDCWHSVECWCYFWIFW